MSTELRVALLKAISLEVWSLDYEPGTDDRFTTANRATSRILALPELVELQRLAAIGRWVEDNEAAAAVRWIEFDFEPGDPLKVTPSAAAFRAAALAAGEPTP